MSQQIGALGKTLGTFFEMVIWDTSAKMELNRRVEKE